MANHVRVDMDYNDGQNPNHWDGRKIPRQDTSGSEYYRQPVHSPYWHQGFTIAASVCGILAIFSNCIFIVSIMFAATGFLFAALQHRSGEKHNRSLTGAIWTCIIGLVAGIIGGFTFFTSTLPTALQDESYRAELEYIWDVYMDAYDIDTDISLEDILGSMGYELGE